MTQAKRQKLSPRQTIAVFGNGIAGYLCVAKLAQDLPTDIEIVFVNAPEPSREDIFYGTVTSPTSYDFLLSIGITEPDLLPHTNTAFSLGTQYARWGEDKRTWTQSFHRPLPIFNGVHFQHYLTRLRRTTPELSDLNTYIMSVQAARKGVFAHPPEGRKTPLADVEYGYQFMPEHWCKMLAKKIETTAVVQIPASVEQIERQDETILSVTLSNGDVVEADFYIDTLGPSSKLRHPKTVSTSTRRLGAVSTLEAANTLGGVHRTLTAKQYGWQSETPLQDGLHRLSVFSPESEDTALAEHGTFDAPPIEMSIGHVTTPWTENCLALGLGAAVLEPLSPAPIMLLQRDIDRLIELVPVSDNMTIESREYNRRFSNDYRHADMLHRALFASTTDDETPYQTAACADPIVQKLATKIEQFGARGVLVQYDYEPFSEADWAMLHVGMGREPVRYDPLADRVSNGQLINKLTQMSGAIEAMTLKMPPHHIYMSGLLRYLKEQHG